MSGGVDSSVAAKLTQAEGYDCIGCTMKLFEQPPGEEPAPEASRTCCSLDDAEDARSVASRLGMPFYVFNYQEEFRRCVMEPFIEDYVNGRTPNPCINCNRDLKFGKLLERARQLDCDCVVTGHYARIQKDPQTGKYLLKKGLDPSKDQSYVLYNLTQDQLAHVRMPLGELEKTHVREIAEEDGFVNANKPDSQDICFVPGGDYAGMIRRYTGKDFPPGEFVDLEGNHMGTHKGIIHYTIGQTRRLGQAFGRPRYVCRIDAASNRIWLGGPDDVYSSYAKAGDFNWISGQVPEGEVRCKVRTRYKQKEQWATVRPLAERGGTEGTPGRLAAEIFFDQPQRAITPGQAAVLYDGDTVLGGGTILQIPAGAEKTGGRT
ncbi:MAG: tRNA 2-thiouridine(34) synthase MnmA [Firmicutes bacterium]|nr:tRNA 2-thiouridine(34) synthase MnmA [Bacillota bacterium]